MQGTIVYIAVLRRLLYIDSRLVYFQRKLGTTVRKFKKQALHLKTQTRGLNKFLFHRVITTMTLFHHAAKAKLCQDCTILSVNLAKTFVSLDWHLSDFSLISTTLTPWFVYLTPSHWTMNLEKPTLVWEHFSGRPGF